MKTKQFNKILTVAKKLKASSKILVENQYHIKDGTISVTDFSTTLTVRCEAVNGIEGAVDRKLIDKFFSKVKDVDFSFDKDGDKLVVKTKFGDRKFKLEKSDMPQTEPVNTELGWFNGSAVIKAGKYVAYNELRPVMNNVYIGQGSIASTDSHQMMFLERETNIEPETLIGIDAVKLLNHGKWSVFSSEKFLRLEQGDFAIIQKVCVYKYPNWRAVIPQQRPRKIVIKDVVMFREQLSMAILAAPKYSGLVAFDGDTLESSDYDFETSFNCKFKSDIVEAGRFGLKGVYLFDYIKDQKEVNIEWVDEGHAFIINDEYLLMPMALG